MARFLPILVSLYLWQSPSIAAAAPLEERNKESAAGEEFFERHVRPLLVARCVECHGPKKQEAGVRLDLRAALLKGGDSGPVIVPGKPDESRLIEVVRYADDDTQMPPKEKLQPDQIEILTRWLKLGAPWPASDAAGSELNPASPEGIKQARVSHWAFRPIGNPQPPRVQNEAWIHSFVDRFVLAKLEGKGIAPSPPADRRTLIRRVMFTLTGLPPTAEEADAFAADPSPQAFEQLVDRLLASPHFGERWARHWLDLSRYADTKGYVFQESRDYPEAYTYRDWVIDAFNRDMPYDEFVVKQIAADMLPDGAGANSQQAMGFLTLGRRFLNNKHDIIDDRIDVVTRGLMGLTVACARCHDHKYDPIPAKDYYSLYGVFASTMEPKDAPSALRLADAPQPFDPYVFLRGQQSNHGDRVPRQFLAIVAGDGRQPFQRGSGRLELAQAIASADNPLTARVIVNRVWNYHFGTGLVRTPSDFGSRSDPPSHPELLDYLSRRFIDEGWSIKNLHRLILNSSVYQQSSQHRPEAAALDPENLLLWKMNRRRLDFEAQRDATLAVAGRLDLTVGGPSVKLTERPFPQRRTVYAFIDRQNLPNMFRTFDFATPDTHSPQRFATTVPQQALFLMNSPFLIEQAEHLAAGSQSGPAAAPRERVRALYRSALGREPNSDELSLGIGFVTAETPVAAGADESSGGIWQYGYGEFDESNGRIREFTPLPHWTGTAWQGGPQLPDPQIGWVFLNAGGGHPGNDQRHAAIRRWTAPRDGVVTITGTLKHPNAHGDGVRSRVVSSRSGVAGEWTVHNSQEETRVDRLEVRQGDTLDFVTDCRTAPSFDGFTWTVQIRLETPERDGRETASGWDSSAAFQGPSPRELGVWEQLAQVLLLSNEFVFVD